jgi:hypothetical protein
VYVSKRRDIASARTCFTTMLNALGRPGDATTDMATPLLRVVDELFPDALHDPARHTNNRSENDHRNSASWSHSRRSPALEDLVQLIHESVLIPVVINWLDWWRDSRHGNGANRSTSPGSRAWDSFDPACRTRSTTVTVDRCGPGAHLIHDAALAVRDFALIDPRRIGVGSPHRVRRTG